MQIVSYNVNGIRSAISKGLLNWMEQFKADVYCFQETKAHSSQVDTKPFELFGYNHYWFSAQKKGYSGVAIFSKQKPTYVEFGFGDKKMDEEGRIIRADFGDTSVVSVYIPSGTSGDERQKFKMEWLSFFQDYIDKLKTEKPNLIVCGDYNICHRPIDIHDPVGNKNSSGFLPEEREWLNTFIEKGFVDSFRSLNPEPHNYTWWTFRHNARNNNKGWRIDYCMVHQKIEDKIKASGIHPEAMHSDHCPTWVEI